MRISVWSSDVCSSDLPWKVLAHQRVVSQYGYPGLAPERLSPRSCGAVSSDVPAERSPIRCWPRRRAIGSGSTALSIALDRKSVVSGKSVSARVDLGGRRYIKQKKKQYNTHIKN